MTPWSCLRFSESRMKTTCIKRPLSIFSEKKKCAWYVNDGFSINRTNLNLVDHDFMRFMVFQWIVFFFFCGSALLVGNKRDLTQRRVVKEDEGEEMAKKLGMSFCECSAVSHSEWGNVGLTVWLAFGDGLKKKVQSTRKKTQAFISVAFIWSFIQSCFVTYIMNQDRFQSCILITKRAIETIIWWHWAQSNRDIRWWRGAAQKLVEFVYSCQGSRAH